MSWTRGLAFLLALAALAVLVCAVVTQACDDPWIEIITPGEDAKVSGSLEVETKVKADAEWTKVEFFLDGNSIGADTIGPPYSIIWDTRNFDAGEHRLQAKGVLTDGTVKESAVVTVTSSK